MAAAQSIARRYAPSWCVCLDRTSTLFYALPWLVLFPDPAKWREQDWRCLRCGEPWDFKLRPRLKTYGSLIRSTLQGVERKRLCADGSEPTRRTRGLLIPRPVHVETKTAIGKEVIVDPTDANEDLTAEMLSATEVLIYENATKRLEALRTKIRATGVKLVARASGVSRSEIQAIVNEGTIPHESTIARLEATLGARGTKASSGRTFLVADPLKT